MDRMVQNRMDRQDHIKLNIDAGPYTVAGYDNDYIMTIGYVTRKLTTVYWQKHAPMSCWN
jgi:hypothetical protein